MQTQSLASQLTMITSRVEYMYKMIGTDLLELIKQFYKAEQVMKIADPLNTEHYAHINKPLQMPTGHVNPDGTLVTSLVWVEDTDELGNPKQDKDGAYMMIPLNDPDTDIQFTAVDLKVVASKGHNADERNQLLMETFVNGPAGQILMQTNPAGFLRTLAMMASEFGTKHSLEIARILMETAVGIEQGSIDPRLAMVGGDLQAIMGGAMGGNNGAGGSAGGTMPSNGSQNPMPTQGSPKSPTLGLPQGGN
ncbi:MAG: hypothetical protein DRH24_19905 [Deltaproteobacteria bacterium]|nr:MAG: hypothetical protein DRH24_19905 [Deltaproteobacteria bacterium]